MARFRVFKQPHDGEEVGIVACHLVAPPVHVYHFFPAPVIGGGFGGAISSVDFRKAVVCASVI